MKLFKKILIANRGEIAVRVIRSANALGIQTVAVYSRADKDSLHVKMADEAYNIGDIELDETYLNIEKIVSVAKKTGCEAIHPGYGFLAENPQFVAACEKSGLVFIGPSMKAIKLMGNKIESREFVKKIGIPMTEGITGDHDTLKKRAKEIPFPILVKAAAGGGGKGMRIVYDEKELGEILESTSREAKSYFGDGTVFIEKYIEEPRHIEIQVLGDNYGNAIHLYERECSIQRRYQKIIEESPSPTLTPEVRTEMGNAAVTIAREIGYSNAGTVEFLVDKDLNFFFLEMNTRVQVEHPVTEMVTGVDIVREQILIAAGKRLEIAQEEIKQHGHAIECRIYAEDPANNFMPSPGKMTLYIEPEGKNIRIDTGIDKATTIESFYDPMISKLIVWGEDRQIAIEKMNLALNNYVIHGIKTNITYLKQLVQHDAYVANTISTKYCDEHTDDIVSSIEKDKSSITVDLPVLAYLLYDFNKWRISKNATHSSIWNQISYWRDIMEMQLEVDGEEKQLEILHIDSDHYQFQIDNQLMIARLSYIEKGHIAITIDDHQYELFVSDDGKGNGYASYDGFIFTISRTDVLLSHEEILGSFDQAAGDQGSIVSPMPGKVIKIIVEEGQGVKKGETLLIVEAMKMENHIGAPSDGIIETINIKQGEMVEANVPLITLQSNTNQ